MVTQLEMAEQAVSPGTCDPRACMVKEEGTPIAGAESSFQLVMLKLTRVLSQQFFLSLNHIY